MVQKNCLNQPIIFVVGPTGSGKSSLAVDLAKKLDGEIISCDSMQIYRYLDIGTAKIANEEMQGIPHYLIDLIEPSVEFSVSDYKNMVEQIIIDIDARGKRIIITGGTGFYVDSILYPLKFGNTDKDTTLRDELQQLALAKGNQYVYDILVSKDSLTAHKLHPNNLMRVIRALEIIANTGTKKSDQNDERVSLYDYKMIGLDFANRQKLYNLINTRVDMMFNSGLVEEVKTICMKYELTMDNQSMKGIGYKELFPFLNGELLLEEVMDKVKLNTRHYAKRQLTWFRNRYDNVQWINVDKVDNILEQALSIIGVK